MRERILIVDDDPSLAASAVAPPTAALALLDGKGHVRALADIEAEAIRFAISHYRGQMSESRGGCTSGAQRFTASSIRSGSMPKSRMGKRRRCNPVTVVEKKIGSRVASRRQRAKIDQIHP
jgi:hypothetical protein